MRDSKTPTPSLPALLPPLSLTETKPQSPRSREWWRGTGYPGRTGVSAIVLLKTFLSALTIQGSSKDPDSWREAAEMPARVKLKQKLTEALHNYFLRRWDRPKKSPVINAVNSSPTSGAQHVVHSGGPMSTLLHTLREVHSYCYLNAMKGKNLKGKKAKKKAAAVAALTAGSNANVTELYSDKISVVDMPDLVQSSLPVALRQHQSRMLTITNASANIETHSRVDVARESISSEMDVDISRAALLVAGLDAIAGIRHVPNAEIGVKGFLVGIKRVLHKQMQDQYEREHRTEVGRESSDAGNVTLSDMDFDTDMSYWGSRSVAESPELVAALKRLLGAIGGGSFPLSNEPGSTSDAGAGAGAGATNAMDMILSMSLSDNRGGDSIERRGIKDSEAEAEAEAATQAHLSFQMVKTLAYALELLPILKHVPVDSSALHKTIAQLLLSAGAGAETGAREGSTPTATPARAKLSKAVSAAGRLFMLKPALFTDVEAHVRPLVESMLERGLYERLTDCLQVYSREVLMPPPSPPPPIPVSSSLPMGTVPTLVLKGGAGLHLQDSSGADFPRLRQQMRLLAEEVATRMSRADLVLRLFAISNASPQDLDDGDGDGGGDGERYCYGDGNTGDAGEPSTAAVAAHYDGRSGSSGDRDAGALEVSPQNALIACRQAHAIAGVFGLTELKGRIQEQLKWIKIVGFASKGKWQFAYQLCSPSPSPSPASAPTSHSGSRRVPSTRSSLAAAHLFNYLKSRGMYSEAHMIWGQEDGFAGTLQVTVVAASSSSLSSSSSSDTEIGDPPSFYVPFVHDHDKSHYAGATVTMVTPQQLQAQQERARRTYLPFPHYPEDDDDDDDDDGVEEEEGGKNRGQVRRGEGCRIVLVNSMETLQEAEEGIFRHNNGDEDGDESRCLSFVGIDAEWKAVIPQYSGGSAFQPAGASLLQVATGTTTPTAPTSGARAYGAVFLFDLDALSGTGAASSTTSRDAGIYSDRAEDVGLLLEETCRVLTLLFRSRTVVKVGWDTNSGDLAMLRAAGRGAFRGCFDSVHAMLDAAKIVSADYREGDHHAIRPVIPRNSKKQLSLSDASSAFLGRPLHKSMQVSDWEARPLSSQQQQYAANDALVLLAIMDTVLGDYTAGAGTTMDDSSGADGGGGGMVIVNTLGLRMPREVGARRQYLDILRSINGREARPLPPLLVQDDTKEEKKHKSALHGWLQGLMSSPPSRR